jgi:hypothetical protein
MTMSIGWTFVMFNNVWKLDELTENNNDVCKVLWLHIPHQRARKKKSTAE